MDFCWRAFALAMLVHGSAFAADTISFAPRDGVLVLRNGFVISGRITPLGESYLVAFGDRGEARLQRTEVEFECGSLDEAYLLKRDSLETDDVKRHLQLADWCLRHELIARAADQLLTARMLDPGHADLPAIERRFQSLATLLAANTAGQAAANVKAPAMNGNGLGIPTVQSLTTPLTNDVPPFLVQQFTVTVQPILLNRCGALACHGVGGTTDFRLMRPTLGQTATNRLTHRNLQATLTQINREDPNSSRLLEMARRPHAGFTADFSEKNANQIELLAGWVRRLGMEFPQPSQESVAAKPVSAESISTANATQRVLALRRQGLNADGTRFTEKKSSAPRAERANHVEPAGTVGGEAGNDASDPFDPAEFNRRYHSRP